jgi:hypothetical protein
MMLTLEISPRNQILSRGTGPLIFLNSAHHPVHTLARIFHELLSRDHEDGRATGQPSRGTAGLVRGVPERYVAGADARGRQEGRSYPWSQQVIHEISGLEQKGTFIASVIRSITPMQPDNTHV